MCFRIFTQFFLLVREKLGDFGDGAEQRQQGGSEDGASSCVCGVRLYGASGGGSGWSGDRELSLESVVTSAVCWWRSCFLGDRDDQKGPARRLD